MPISSRDTEVIELFVTGNLSKEDQSYFDSRSNDPEFMNAVEEERTLFDVIRAKGREGSKAKLEKLESSIQSKSTPVFSINSTYRYVLAAMFALLVTALIWVNLLVSSSSDLYEEYYAPYPNLIDPLTKGSDTKELSAYQLYELQEYKRSIKLLDTDRSTDALWYKAQAHIAEGNYEHAQSLLSVIEQLETSEYKDDAEWYRALILIKLEKEEGAVELLNRIQSNDQHNYFNKASTLLKDLR